MLLPGEPSNHYETREIVPPEMLPDIRRAEIVIANHHRFRHREAIALSKVARSFMRAPALKSRAADPRCGHSRSRERDDISQQDVLHVVVKCLARRWPGRRRVQQSFGRPANAHATINSR